LKKNELTTLQRDW